MNRKNASPPKRNRLKKTVELASFPELNPNPVSEVDLDGQIHYLNPSARRLFPTLEARGLDHPWLVDWKSVAGFFRNRKTQPMLRQVTIGGRYYQQAISYVAVSQHVRIYGLDITGRVRAEQALQDSETRYRRLFETAQDGILILDAETGQIADVNPFLIEMLGYTREELRGKKLWECGPFRDVAASKAAFVELQNKGHIRYEDLPLENSTGQRVEVEFVSNVYQVDHKKVIQCNIRDITVRKKKEAELHRLNRTLRALSNINQAMMRAQDEAEFLQQVCQIVVEDCGHAMVWIGYAEADEAKTVRPVAYAGFEKGYLETLKITWADTERGRGPTGTAIRKGKPSACRNMLTDPNFKPWREEALKRGYASSIVFPLMAGGKAFGAITIYSREPDPFSDDEVNLLSELADDLAFGITANRLRVAHGQAEEALRRSEERYRSLFNAMTEGFALHEIICDEEAKPCDYRFLDMNPAFERLTGLKREQVIGRTMREVLPEDDPAWIEAYGKVALTGEPVHFENYSLALNRHYEVFAYRPAPRQFAVVFSEITERKRSEELLRKNEATLRGILDATQESIWLFSPNGIILLGNETALSRLRRPAEQVIGKSFSQLMPEELARSRQMHLNEVVETGRPVELVDERAGIIFHHHFYPIKDADGRVIQIVAFSRDITERERAEEALRESEERFKVIASSTPDHLIVQDRDLRYTFVVNPQLGLTEQEMVGKTDYDFLSKDDAENLTRIKRQVLETGNAVHVEVPLISPKGETQFFSGSYVPKHNAEGQIDGLIGYFQNVTDLKRAEEALRASRDDLERTVAERTAELQSANVRLRSLTQDIVSTQEEERRRVSRELHDEAGQALTALKLSLQMMHDELPSGWAKYRQHLVDAVTLTDKTLEQIRMLAHDLRPPALDAAGLDATLEGLCREFAHRTQIQIHYNGTALPNLGSATICLYRFLQEALTNAARHGHATEIQVRFEKDAEHICLSVEDNGQGFDAQKVLSDQGNPKSMGLIGMQERINMVGGRLEISSNPGCGTRLIARVPLETA